VPKLSFYLELYLHRCKNTNAKTHTSKSPEEFKNKTVSKSRDLQKVEMGDGIVLIKKIFKPDWLVKSKKVILIYGFVLLLS